MIEITAAQVRAARALLAWSQRDLAERAQVATSTIADFERGHRTPVSNNLEAIRRALEGAGATFMLGGAVAGEAPLQAPGAKLLPGNLLRWVTATDLSQWGGTRVGQDTLPELVSRLIRASVGSAANLSFPSGDSVQLPGLDGICEVGTGTEYIPTGRSGWELGTQRDGIARKADDDYRKRTRKVPPDERARTTFVFVTPQRWSGKEKWLRAKHAAGDWLDVRAHDADTLVHWIELHPFVGHWLASLIGKRPPGIRRLDEAWAEWSLTTKVPLGAELVLAGRDEEAAKVLRWLREGAGTMAVQADAPDEAIAFLHAAICQLPPGHRDAYLSRAFVASAEQARALGEAMSSMVLVLEQPDPGLAATLARRHHVYVPSGPDLGDALSGLPLPRPFRHDVEEVLTAMGLSEPEAHKLAQASARSATVVRRLIPGATGVLTPAWATRENAGVVLPALLAGVWDDTRPGDRRALERLGGIGYAELETRLAAWTSGPDAPLRKVGNAWRIASSRDAWFRLAQYLSPGAFQVFIDVAVEVLSSADARYDMPDAERWLAPVRGVEPECSDLLKAGLAETLALVAVHGARAANVPRAAERAEAAASAVLEGADRRRWWSLSPHLRALAEASPNAFLGALDESLNVRSSPLMALFGHDKDGGITADPRHADLLWALECLAWDRAHLRLVADILARLDQLDPGGKYSNRPLASLRRIFLLWFPQTSAPLEVRLKVLDGLRKHEPEAAWRLLIELVPKDHDMSVPSPLPRWRDFADAVPAPVTYAERFKGAETVVGWLLQDAGTDTARWRELLELLPQFSPERRLQAMERLEQVARNIADETGRSQLEKALRHLIHRQREFADAGWTMAPGEVDELERIHRLLIPGDAVEGAAWLFEGWHVKLLRPNGLDWEADTRDADALRREAVERLVVDQGVDAVQRLARRAAEPKLVGIALAQSGCGDQDKHAVLVRALRQHDEASAGLASGMVSGLFAGGGGDWLDALLSLAAVEGWETAPLARILLALPSHRETWDRAATFGKAVEKAYWMGAFVSPQDLKAGDTTFVATKFLAAGRARAAVRFLGHAPQRVNSDLLIGALEAAAAETPSDLHGSDSASMLEYHVERILEHLENAGDVPRTVLVRLEWIYLPLLEHSPRGLRILHDAMAREPAFFIEVLTFLYRPDPESGVEPEKADDPKVVKARASRAFRLLHSWTQVPGSDGVNIDANALEAWVREARLLCGKVGRLAIGDQQIGRMLAHAPTGEDGFWPSAAVRGLIEAIRSRNLELGVMMGLHDKLGVTVRGSRDGGGLERDEAAKYMQASRGLESEWPRTSALLSRVARGYESQARSMDDEVERDA